MIQNKRFETTLLLSVGTLLLSTAVGAEPVVELDEFRVTASLVARTAEDFAQPVEVLTGGSLGQRLTASIGETLAGLPGVASTQYFPGASRPVIRGYSNDRIRVLSNGLDVIDASVGSHDHAVAIEPYRVERIEIVRGPATLAFGGNTVGGMVNVVDNRIPGRDAKPEQGIFSASLDSATDGFSASGSALVQVGEWGVRGGGLVRRHGDLRIPGRAALDPELAVDQPEGRLENSFVRTDEASLGIGRAWEGRHAGMAVMYFATRYGLGREVEEEVVGIGEDGQLIIERELDDAVRIDLEQWRWDGRWGTDGLGRWAETLEVKLGLADYWHAELEDGEIGTEFRNRGFEGRVEATHDLLDDVSGVLGLQVGQSRFEATGDEAFLRPTRTDSLGLFLFEEWKTGQHTLQAGVRWDHRRIRPELYERDEITGTTVPPDAYRGDAFSGALGWIYRPDQHLRFNLNLGHTERLPGAQELYADGPHIGTFAYEVSDHLERPFAIERAHTIDAGFSARFERLTLGVDLFVHQFRNFISLRRTGELAFENEDDSFTLIDRADIDEAFLTAREAAGEDTEFLQVTRYQSTRARFYGGEVQATLDLFSAGEWESALTLRADRVLATDRETGESLPRITPTRVTARWDLRSGPWTGGLEAQRHFARTRLAPFETPTRAFTLVKLDATYTLVDADRAWRVFGRVDNLLDREARSATSFVKDLAPLGGRSLRLGVDLLF